MEKNHFKLARTEYNKNGFQSVKTVADLTGVSKSLIDDLEANVGPKRDVGYSKIRILAEHYGVSTDYLCGLSIIPNPSIDERTAAATTGLSGAAVRQLSILSAPERLGGDWTTLHAINTLIEALGDPTASGSALCDIADFFKVPIITSQDFTADAHNKIMKSNLDSDVMARVSTKAIESMILQELAKSLQYVKENYYNKDKSDKEG